MDPRHSLGERGEDLACLALHAEGYDILARRYRTRHGEIDVVARDGPTVVFVEVKTRRGSRFGSGAEAVTAWKQRRITRMAEVFLLQHHLSGHPCRFDVVTVDLAAAPRIQVIRGAF